MATQEPGQVIAREGAVDLTGKEYFLVKFDATGKLALCGLGEQAQGAIQEGKAAGLHSTAMISGISKVVAGVAITAGDAVASDAAGKLKVVAATENIVGYTTKSAAADGVIIPVRLAVAGIL
jgi:hypothetical protein